MKIFILIIFFISSSVLSQTNTEIHVFDIVKKEESYILKNGKNISNNNGYDSQPFFYENDKVLFTSEKNGQTEIVLSNLNSTNKNLNYRSNTSNG